MTTEAAVAAQPLCALHPDLPSAGTCARCGRFACERCFRLDTGLCVECEARTADPLGVGGTFSIGGALASGWRLFVAARWTALGVSVAMAIAGTATSSLAFRIAPTDPASYALSRGTTDLISTAKELLLGTWVYGALLAQMAGAARGECISGWQAVARSARAWPRMFWAQFVATFIFLLGLAALVVPGLYAATALWVVMPAAYLEPGQPAVQVSSALTRGRRWEVLALLVASRSPLLVLLVARYVSVSLLFRADFALEQRALALGGVHIALDLLRCGVESFSLALVLAAYLKLRRAATLTS